MRLFAFSVILLASGPAFAEITPAQAVAACDQAIVERAQSAKIRFKNGSFEGRVMKLKFRLTGSDGKRSRAECRVSKRDGTVTAVEVSDS